VRLRIQLLDLDRLLPRPLIEGGVAMDAAIRKAGEQGAGAWRLARWSAIFALLLLPLVAMQFTDEIAWSGFDFAAAALLLVGAGAIYEIAGRILHERRRRLVVGTSLVAVVLVVWAQGAVGIF
jgi:hypothetical protein